MPAVQATPSHEREELSGGLATFDLLTATDRRPAVAISTLAGVVLPRRRSPLVSALGAHTIGKHP